ncbi:hypothetical protein G5C51_14890 [Streptomyces sp. A7024]|uniref:Transposase (putative) YhgA-like domain-containing protein n=1 Tax=Streptomyces coryli TaxID=1128680 RepID=A0A6G4U093_9ACTN|nr:hypothetical protein [Streptomyces coryli]NGN65180.1 hypothetical protein [Streptomyces coryli]
MVSSNHEAMHRIFQEDPGVFARTFRALGMPLADPVAVSVFTPDLTEIRPMERRLDTLLHFETSDGEGFLLAVEAQGKRDADKAASWAYYLAFLNAKYELPTVLLVVSQDAHTARWAAGPFHFGIHEWTSMIVRPFVLGPHNVPVITDVALAAEDIPLATLSAITHSKDENAGAILRVLFSALKKIDKTTAHIFAELTELGLGSTPALDLWRDLMAADLSFFRSETSMRLRAQSRAEDIVRLLELRGIEVSDDARERILSCSDLDILTGWFDRAATASSADDVFSEDRQD